MLIRDVKPGQKFRMSTKKEFLKIETVQVLVDNYLSPKNVISLHPEDKGKVAYLPENFSIETILFP